MADSYEDARRLSLPGALAFTLLRQGRPGVLPTVAEAYPWTPQERTFAEQRLDGQVLGSVNDVQSQLGRLLADTGASELMVTTTAHALSDRLRSYELLASLGTVDSTLALSVGAAAGR